MNGIGAVGGHSMAQMTTVRSRSHISEGSSMEEMHESQAEKMRELQQGGGTQAQSNPLSMNGIGNKVNLFA